VRLATVIIAIGVMDFGACAQECLHTGRLDCRSLQAFVCSNGHAILRIGSNVHERYVRDQAACLTGQSVLPRWVPSADQARCFVGYSCIERDHEGSRG
jgi:hypothetical protein